MPTQSLLNTRARSLPTPVPGGLRGDGGKPVVRVALAGLLLALSVLAGCGGSSGGAGSDSTAAGTTPTTSGTPDSTIAAAGTMTTADAVRLANQASFGANETLVNQIRGSGATAWLTAQMAARGSRYTGGGGDAVHRNTNAANFCDQPGNGGATCWRDNFASDPLLWDFYRNAMTQPDQVRQRVAFALQQILVVSNREVHGTYGLRNYHNRLLDLALGNYRDVLRAVALSPVMGDYLNNVNNHRNAPNENFARELLQLFAIGTCELNADGRLSGGACKPTYNNETVRAYAYALTGWTYPPGGSTSYGCWPSGANCQYYGGDMVAVPAFHDTQARRLLSGVSVPAGSSAEQALDAVLDSLMQHPSMAPFIGRQLIQHLVSANPSPAYVQRVGEAFVSGRYTQGGSSFGQGRRGDLAATVAAVLLDEEARQANPRAEGGKLREPALMFTGVLRALNGTTDGDALGWWWGDDLSQMVFQAPSVFNFYPPDYPVAGTSLVGPAFGIHNAGTGSSRLNFLTFLIYWGGAGPGATVPGATGTRVNLASFEGDATDPAKLVDRLSTLAFGEPLPAVQRNTVIDAVAVITSANTDAKLVAIERVRQAAYLIFASPRFQVLR